MPVSESLGVGRGAISYYMTFLWLATIVFLPLAGRLFTKLDVRIVTSVAVVAMVVAFFLQSMVTELWQYWACGFLMGLGITILLFLTTSSLVNRWFKKRAGFLIGVAMAFTGIGGVIWNPIIGALINDFGWQFAFRIEAIIAAVCALPFTLFVLRGFPSDKGLLPFGDDGRRSEGVATESALFGLDASKAYRTKAFVLLAIFTLLINVGMYGYQMTAAFISSLPISVSLPLLAASVSSVAMAGQTLGKIFLGIVGDKSVNAGVLIALLLGIVGMLGYLFLNGSDIGLYVSGACFGVFYALTNVILPIMTRALFGTRDYVRIYARVSMVAAFGSIIQAPLLGTTIDMTGGYSTMFVIIIVMFVIAAAFAVLAMRAGKNLPAQFE